MSILFNIVQLFSFCYCIPGNGDYKIKKYLKHVKHTKDPQSILKLSMYITGFVGFVDHPLFVDPKMVQHLIFFRFYSASQCL